MNARFLPFVLLIVAAVSTMGASTPTPAAAPEKHEGQIQFDEFIVVLLVRPPNAPETPADELKKLQEGHIANIHAMAADGKLVKAGPMEDYSGRNIRGMFILKTDSKEKASEWIAGDPLIKAGRLVPEFVKWYVEKGTLK